VRAVLVVPVFAIFLAGCASISTGMRQTIVIETRGNDGVAAVSMQCSLENDRGHWTVTVPGSVEVSRSSADLRVRCAALNSSASATAVSRANDGMWANMLLSCGLGMPIDHWTGAGYDYPSPLVLWIGRDTLVDKQGASTPPSAGTSTPPRDS
jgi:hypothetical protein